MRFLLLPITLLLMTMGALAATIGDDGLHKTPWMRETFKDLAEDLEEATAEGKHLLVLIEQRGCIYCRKMHEEVFVVPQIDEFITENFFVVQLNMFGDVEVTDFDGATMSEKDMVRNWGMTFTPTMMVFPQTIETAQSAPDLALIVIPGAMEASETLSFLMWASDPDANQSQSLSAYHEQRING